MADFNNDKLVPLQFEIGLATSRPVRPSMPDIDEDEFFSHEADFPPMLARSHQLTRNEADELLSLLEVCGGVQGFRLTVHFGMAMFVEAQIDKSCHPINDHVSQTLAAVASGNYGALQGTDRGAVIVAATLEDSFRPPTSILETLEGAARIVSIAASLKEAMRKKRQRPPDDELSDFLYSYYAEAAATGASLRLGSHDTIDDLPPPLVASAKRALLLVGERGLAVLENRPELSVDGASEARAYFRYLGNLSARNIAGRLMKLRDEKRLGH